jgi:hypothetical protein
MAHSTSHGHVSQEDLERGDHQEDALDFGAVIKTGVGLVVVTLISYGIVLGVYAGLERFNADSGERRYPLAAGQENRLPPEPRLQTNPKQDLRDLRALEADTLDHYSWVDRNGGVVRIPIENAMRLTLERGLPSRAAAPAGTEPAASAPAAAAPAAASAPVPATTTSPAQERH